MTQYLLDRVNSHLKASITVKEKLLAGDKLTILAAANLIAEEFQKGNKLLICGNGGSAADCQHVACEFVSRLSKDRERRALPAIALTTDTSFLTAYPNDYSFDGIFARQIEALGNAGDVLIAISTGGSSKNIIAAVEQAKNRSLKVISLSGERGAIVDMANIAITVPSANTQFIQEAHLAIEHILCDLVEEILFGKI